jgi:Fic family protein
VDILENLSASQKKELLKQLKVSWTYTSNAIEGNTLSLGDTAFVIEYGLTIKGKPLRDHNDIIGHAVAIDLVYALIKQNIITKEDVFSLHKAVQTAIIIDIDRPIGDYKVEENGRYLNINNKATYLPYPAPKSIPHLMGLFFKVFGDISKPLASFDECVTSYTDMHIAFSSIHPFFDGNGRLARLIANIPLLKNGFLPIIISNEDRQEYIELLSTYNLNAPALDHTSSSLVEKNSDYDRVLVFFKDQYKNSQILLDELRNSRR